MPRPPFFLLSLVLSCSGASLFVSSATAESAPHELTAAEEALLKNDFSTASEKFARVARDDGLERTLRGRALRGQALAHLARGQSEESISALVEAAKSDPRYPWNGAVLWKIQELRVIEGPSPGWASRLEELEALPDYDSKHHEFDLQMLRAIDADMHGDVTELRRVIDEINPVRDLLLLGPFENSGGSGIDEIYPPEREIDPDASYRDRNGRLISWTPSVALPYGSINLDVFLDNEPNAIAYALTHVRVDEKQEAVVCLSGAGSSRAWLNGELILDEHESRNAVYRLYEVPVVLRKGWNQLLVKQGCELTQLILYLRLTDRAGGRFDYEVSARPPSGTEFPAPAAYTGPAPPTGLERFPEDSPYRSRDPGVAETNLTDQLFRIEALRHRDLVDEMTMAIEAAENQFPDAALVKERRAWVMARKGSGDATGVLRAAAAQSPGFYAAQVAVIQELFERGEADQAWHELERIKGRFEDSAALRSLHGFLRMARGDVVAGLEEIRRAFEQAPGNVGVHTIYLLALETQNDQAQFEAGLSQVLTVRPDIDALSRRAAAVAYRKRDYDRAIEHLEHALAVGGQPAVVCGEMAVIHESAGKVERAIEACERGLRWAPQSETLEEKLGMLLLKQGHKDEARIHLVRALELEPGNTAVRQLIRTVDGKKPLQDYFTRSDLKTLSTSDLSWANPVATAVILVDEVEVILFPDGASEYRHHYAVRVLSEGGVADFRTVELPSDAIFGGEIEIAKVIKEDGREIEAEKGFGALAFAELEPSDIIEIRYVVNQSPSPGLADHFWYDNKFQFAIPCVVSRFSFLRPADWQFDTEVHNAKIKPTSGRHGEWTLDVWEMKEIPASPVELLSPPEYEIVAWLDLSSIESWDTVTKWYEAQSRGRLRATGEIKELARELGSDAPSDSARIHRVADYVRANIKYEGGQFIDSATIPRSAAEVLRTRYGDCKDQSGLIISLLRELGVRSRYVLVNSREETITGYLPSPRFTHAIVCAWTSESAVHWIDPTDPYLSFPNIPVELEGMKALLIDPGAPAQFVTIDEDPPILNGSRSRIDAAIDGDSKLTVALTSDVWGEDAAVYRELLETLPEYKDDVVKEVIGIEHPGATISDVEIAVPDGIDDPVTVSAKIERPADVSTAGEMLIVRIPWTTDKVPLDLVTLEERRYPLVLGSWKGIYREEVRLVLPEGYEPLGELPHVELECPAGAFRLSGRRDEAVILEKVLELRAIEVGPADYAKFREFLHAAFKAEQEQLVLRSKTE